MVSALVARGHALTPRQRQIVRLVTAGCQNKEIAGRLRIAESTVKWHVSVLFRALTVSSRVELVQRAHDLGLVPTGRQRRAAAVIGRSPNQGQRTRPV